MQTFLRRHQTRSRGTMLNIAFIALFCITIVIAPIAWLRMLTAKTQRAYVANIALFLLPMLAVFALGHLSGAIDLTATPKNELSEGAPLPQLSWLQTLLLSVAGALWLVGGNVLMYRHTKRMGRSFWSFLNPFKPQFRDFAAHEWVALALLAASALSLGMLAMHLSPQ